MSETGGPFLPLAGLQPLRWLKSGRLLAAGAMNLAPHVPVDPNKTAGLFVLPFGLADVRTRSKETYDFVAPRPTVAAANRAGILPALPVPPPQWSVLKTQTVSPLGSKLPEWPAAFSDTQAAVIQFKSEANPNPRLSVAWQRFDLANGRAIGTVPLWPWSAPFQDSEELTYWTTRAEGGTVAALTADGNRLALRDPVDPCRVDVWEADGRRLVGIRPYDDKPVDWLGFTADGNLLTLGRGKLTAWQIPEAKAVYEVDGGYAGAGHFAPGRGWLVATAGGRVDCLDSATGRCLGRIEDQPYADGPGHTISISPDGRRLVRVGIGQAKPHGGNDLTIFTLARIWDTTTGKPFAAIRIGGVSLRGLFWLSPHQFLANDQLVDVNAGAAVCGYRYPNDFPRPSGHERIAARGTITDADLTCATPQGRLFVRTNGGWKALAIPAAGNDSVLNGTPEFGS